MLTHTPKSSLRNKYNQKPPKRHLCNALCCTVVSAKSIPRSARDPALLSSPVPTKSPAFPPSTRSGLECFAWLCSSCKNHIKTGCSECQLHIPSMIHERSFTEQANCSYALTVLLSTLLCRTHRKQPFSRCLYSSHGNFQEHLAGTKQGPRIMKLSISFSLCPTSPLQSQPKIKQVV